MTSRSSSPPRKSTAVKSAAKSTSKTGKLPEWDLADLYSGIDAPEVARDLAKMDTDCVAFETDYKGKLAEFTATEGGRRSLAQAVRRSDAIDDPAAPHGSSALLAHAAPR